MFSWKKVYSQEGEELILDRIFEEKRNGFYIDIGAHHPYRFSNTISFYKKGWSGINVDAMPGSMILFNRFRRRDINVEAGIANDKGRMVYYIFKERALNTFDESRMKWLEKNSPYRHIEEKEIEVFPLHELLDKYMINEDKTIDFLDIDVEGLDLAVLQSNDWSKYRPNIIIAEANPDLMISDILNEAISIYLKQQDYSLYSRLYNSLIFINNRR